MSVQQREVDWNGEAYHRLSDMQFNQGMELLDTLSLQGNELILDAGCGSGRITKEILTRLPTGSIIGVDLSERMLDTARREVTAGPSQKVEFIFADLQTFRPTLQVDGIFSNMALHFIADHTLLFSNFAHILKPGGFIGLQYGTRQTQHPSAMRLMDMLSEAPYKDYFDAKVFHFAGGDAEGDRQALQAAGFTDISVKTIHMHPIEEQIEKMREFIRTTMVQDCTARLPENLREQFRRDAEGALTQTFSTGYEFEYLQVHARAPALH